MPYEQKLAQRIRTLLAPHDGITEKKMFGGLSFLHRGNMCCGVTDDTLVLRLGEELSTEALAKEHTKICDFTGRPMKTMIMVAPEGVEAEEGLAGWIEQALSYVSTLPAKQDSSR